MRLKTLPILRHLRWFLFRVKVEFKVIKDQSVFGGIISEKDLDKLRNIWYGRE
jgi:hypothetical protein